MTTEVRSRATNDHTKARESTTQKTTQFLGTPVHHEVLYPWLETDRSPTLNDDDTSDVSLVPMEAPRQPNIWRCADSKPKHLSESHRLGQRE